MILTRFDDRDGGLVADTSKEAIVGDGALDIPSAAWRLLGVRENLPIEVKFVRRNAGDGVPYGEYAAKRETPLSLKIRDKGANPLRYHSCSGR